jgi:hypothetical protein
VTSGGSRCICGYHQLEYQNRDIAKLVETLASLHGVEGVTRNGEREPSWEVIKEASCLASITPTARHKGTSPDAAPV